MKKRELGDYIQDILEALGEVEDFTNGMQFEDFVKDKNNKCCRKELRSHRKGNKENT